MPDFVLQHGPFGILFSTPNFPRKSLCVSPFFCLLSQEVRHINLLLAVQTWRFSVGSKKFLLKKIIQKPGDHPNFRKNALGVKRPFSELSESFGVFSEQLSELEIPFSEYEIPFSEWPLTTWSIRNPQFSEQLSEWFPELPRTHPKDFHLPLHSRSVFSRIGVVPAHQNYVPYWRGLCCFQPCLSCWVHFLCKQLITSDNAKLSPLASQDGHCHHDRRDQQPERADKSLAHKTLSGHPGHRSSRPGARAKTFIFLAFRG